jgi:hypothetical protein
MNKRSHVNGLEQANQSNSSAWMRPMSVGAAAAVLIAAAMVPARAEQAPDIAEFHAAAVEVSDLADVRAGAWAGTNFLNLGIDWVTKVNGQSIAQWSLKLFGDGANQNQNQNLAPVTVTTVPTTTSNTVPPVVQTIVEPIVQTVVPPVVQTVVPPVVQTVVPPVQQTVVATFTTTVPQTGGIPNSTNAGGTNPVVGTTSVIPNANGLGATVINTQDNVNVSNTLKISLDLTMGLVTTTQTGLKVNPGHAMPSLLQHSLIGALAK